MYIWTDAVAYINEPLQRILSKKELDDLLYAYWWINEAVLLHRRLVLKTIECDSWKERSRELEHQVDLGWDAYNDAMDMI